MKIKIFFWLLFLGNLFHANAQNELAFINPINGKLIHARLGDELVLVYKGYLGQTEYYKGSIANITDSSVFIGFYMPELVNPESPAVILAGLGYKEVKLIDITAFRRSSVWRNMLKNTLNIGVAVGSILLLNQLYQGNANLSLGAKYGISLGVGLGSRIVLNQIFSDKPKYKMKDGWQVKLVIRQ